MSTLDKKRKFIIDSVYLLIIFGIILGLFKYVLPLIIPFIVGLAIAIILKPLVNFLTNKLGIKSKFATVIALVLFYFIVLTITIFGGVAIIASMQQMFMNLPALYQNDVQPILNDVIEYFVEFVNNLDPTLNSVVNTMGDNIISTFTSIVTTFSSNAIKYTTDFITSIPGIFTGFLFAVISSVFFTTDYQNILNFVKKQLSENTRYILSSIRDSLKVTVVRFIRAYGIIMFITFVELNILLLILGVNNSMGVAFFISLVDILPILGTGGVLIPWVIIELINGNIFMGVGLFIGYLIITFIRNMIEPKIVGDQVGLYPLVTLIAMYVGASLFGVIGLFGFPITIVVLLNLRDRGIIKLYK
jgi:sporulation integral membrane protein YtvI